MHHPGHSPAEYENIGTGSGFFQAETRIKKIEMFPDVTVFTVEDEKSYAAKGYRPNVMTNAAEYEQSILDAEANINGGGFQEFPKWKYHHFEAPELVNNKKEEKALGEGWFDNPAQAEKAA